MAGGVLLIRHDPNRSCPESRLPLLIALIICCVCRIVISLDLRAHHKSSILKQAKVRIVMPSPFLVMHHFSKYIRNEYRTPYPALMYKGSKKFLVGCLQIANSDLCDVLRAFARDRLITGRSVSLDSQIG